MKHAFTKKPEDAIEKIEGRRNAIYKFEDDSYLVINEGVKWGLETKEQLFDFLGHFPDVKEDIFTSLIKNSFLH